MIERRLQSGSREADNHQIKPRWGDRYGSQRQQWMERAASCRHSAAQPFSPAHPRFFLARSIFQSPRRVGGMPAPQISIVCGAAPVVRPSQPHRSRISTACSWAGGPFVGCESLDLSRYENRLFISSFRSATSSSDRFSDNPDPISSIQHPPPSIRASIRASKNPSARRGLAHCGLIYQPPP